MRYIVAVLLGALLACPVFVVDFFTTQQAIVRVCELEAFEEGDLFTSARTTAGIFMVPAPTARVSSRLYDAMTEGHTLKISWRGGNAIPQLLRKADPFDGIAPSC